LAKSANNAKTTNRILVETRPLLLWLSQFMIDLYRWQYKMPA